MIGTLSPRARSRRQTSNPSRSGRTTSSTIRSGCLASASPSAPWPVAAVSTVQPWKLSATCTSSRMFGSSSTTSTVGMCLLSAMVSRSIFTHSARGPDHGLRRATRERRAARRTGDQKCVPPEPGEALLVMLGVGVAPMARAVGATVMLGVAVGVMVMLGATVGVVVVVAAFSTRMTLACRDQSDRVPAMKTRAPRCRPAAGMVAGCFHHIPLVCPFCQTMAMLLVTVTEIVMPVPAMFTETVWVVGASICCAVNMVPDALGVLMLPVSMLVAGTIWPAIAAVAAALLPVIAVVPVMLEATLVTLVPCDSHHTLSLPLADRTSTQFLVARITRPRSKASMLWPCHICVR